MGSTGINHLPPELLCKIFSNLSISSKLACRAVSTTWNDIVSQSSELWPGEHLEPFSVLENILKFLWYLFLFLKVCLYFHWKVLKKFHFLGLKMLVRSKHGEVAEVLRKNSAPFCNVEQITLLRSLCSLCDAGHLMVRRLMTMVTQIR